MTTKAEAEKLGDTLTDMKVDIAEVKAGVKAITTSVGYLVEEAKETRRILHEPPHEVITRLKMVETKLDTAGTQGMTLKEVVSSTWFKVLVVAILTALGAKNIEGVM